MKVTGSYTLDAPRTDVWPHIFDPAALAGLRITDVFDAEWNGRFAPHRYCWPASG